MTDPDQVSPATPRLEGAGVSNWGRPLWWARREPIEGATTKEWAEAGGIFLLELFALIALLATIVLLEATHHLGQVAIFIAVGLSLMIIGRVAHRMWIRRDAQKEVIEWNAEHHRDHQRDGI